MDLWANELEFEAVNDSNVEELKQLNRGIFPINYQDKVYADVIACGDISQIARLKKKVVGGIACRLENNNSGPIMYIITLGVLAPYRNLGLGSLLLQKSVSILRDCVPEVASVHLHVQVNNDDAIRFYEKSGFKIAEVIKDYYMRIQPRDAVLLTLDTK